jgi:membrane associated rhomboid family serine protease
VIAFIAELSGGSAAGKLGGGSIVDHGALYGPAIHLDHEYWRLVTGGFLHAGLLHIGFNMYLLYVLGQMLEPGLGALRFGVIYVVSLLAGSAGALLASPDTVTVGASGAVFGLMGAGFVALRARGFDPMQSGIGATIALNLLITFAIPGISIGGHVGGLVGGAAAGWLLVDYGERQRSLALPYAACAVLAAIAVAVGIAAAGSY